MSTYCFHFLEPLLGAINTTLYKNLRHHCSGAKDDIVCRKDGVLRLAEPGSGENLSCVVVFILVSQIEFFKPIKGLLAEFEVNLFKVSCVLNSQVSFTFSDYLSQQVFRYCHLFKFWIQFRLQKKVVKQISCIVPFKKNVSGILFFTCLTPESQVFRYRHPWKFQIKSLL